MDPAAAIGEIGSALPDQIASWIAVFPGPFVLFFGIAGLALIVGALRRFLP